MKLKFQPMPVLTGLVAVMLAILISLGVWQYQRLQWKTDLLAEVEASVTAPPLTSLDDLERAIKAGEPVDFRRIIIDVELLTPAPRYHVYKTQTGGIYWDVFWPVIDNRRVIFEQVYTFENDEKDKLDPLATFDPAPIRFGYVREDHPMGLIESLVKSKPNPSTNRWFKFNQDGSWGEGLDDYETRLSHYIETDLSISDVELLPIRRPTIRNNHRDYMLTWFSFAGLLLIFYVLIHKRAGRLSW